MIVSVIMKKWLLVSILFTVPHVLEDVGLFFLGRYTNIPTWVMIAFIIVMGLGVGAFVRQKHVRRFLGH